MNNWVMFESLEIKRGGYYVKYDPLVIGNAESKPFVSVRIIDDLTISECKEIVEMEYRYWFKRFPVPLQVNLRYEKSREHYCEQLVGCSYVCGEELHKFRWGGFIQSELDKAMPTETELKRIYKGLAFTTSSEAQMKINADLRSRKLLKYWAVTTLVVFPAIISFLGWSTPVFAAISLIYAWYKCADKWLAINGQKIKSEAEVAKEEEQRLMEHHHYHCVRNPEAFDKLKHENFRINQARKRDDKLELMESSFLEQN